MLDKRVRKQKNVGGNSEMTRYNKSYLFLFVATAPSWVRASSFMRFIDHTQRSATVGRTPLDERSARRRDLYLTTHNIHNRQTSIHTVGFQPTITASEQPQSYALDCTATGTGTEPYSNDQNRGRGYLIFWGHVVRMRCEQFVQSFVG
jgi:hypothetical protein